MNIGDLRDIEHPFPIEHRPDGALYVHRDKRYARREICVAAESARPEDLAWVYRILRADHLELEHLLATEPLSFKEQQLREWITPGTPLDEERKVLTATVKAMRERLMEGAALESRWSGDRMFPIDSPMRIVGSNAQSRFYWDLTPPVLASVVSEESLAALITETRATYLLHDVPSVLYENRQDVRVLGTIAYRMILPFTDAHWPFLMPKKMVN